MAADTLKSLSITALDATPPPTLTYGTGEGVQGYGKDIGDWVLPTTGGLVSTSSIYKLVRMPTNAKLKSLVLSVDGLLDTGTSLTLDVGAYYSDATNDGTAVANQGVLISANCFLAASTAYQSSAVADVNALAAYSVKNRNLPLWLGLGLATDPGGMIDVVLAVHAAAQTAAAHNVGIKAAFVM